MIRSSTFRARIEGLEGFFMVNGIPLTTWNGGLASTTYSNEQVARWLRRGSNVLSAVTQPSRYGGRRTLEAELLDHRGETLATLQPHTDAAPNGLLQQSFDIDEGSATTLWSEAEILEDVDAHRNELDQRLAQIQTSILDRDTTALLGLRAYVLRDEARLHPDRFEDRDWTVVARSVHDDILQDRTLRLARFATDRVRYELVGEGRILSVWSGRRTPPLRFVDSDGESMFSMELHLARIGSNWVWVR